MSHFKLEDVSNDPFETSLLASCLAKLTGIHSTVAPAPVAETPKAPVLSPGEWLDQWAEKQSKITRRLKLIESELNRLGHENFEPQLSIYSPAL